MQISDLRSDIPALEECIYLNYASHGPSPRQVVDHATSTVEYFEYNTCCINRADQALAKYECLREKLAEFIGANTCEIAFSESTTEGINKIANAFDWKPGDTVVRTDLEHQAGILPWEQLRRQGINVNVVETQNGCIDVEEFRDTIEDAKLVCFSALSHTLGSRLPVQRLGKIAADTGVFSLVDAVQLPGQQRIDVQEWNVDAVAAAGHKWMLSPQGSGFFYFNEDSIGEVVPNSIGPRGVESISGPEIHYRDGAPRFEIGSTSLAAHSGLGKSIEIINEIGIETIESRIRELAEFVKKKIPQPRLLSPQNFHSGIVTIKANTPTQVANTLEKDDILVEPLPRLQAIRISIHATTTWRDIHKFVNAIDGIV